MAIADWLLARARVSGKTHQKVRMDDKMAFFQQFSTLIASGTPLLQALRIGAEQNQSLRFRRVLEVIQARVAAGSPVYAAAAAHPEIFETHWIEVLRTGEITGQMSLVLQDLNRQIQESRATYRKVIGALVYPMILMVVAVIAVAVMLWLVVPAFAGMFKDLGATLPDITQFVMDASGFVVEYGLYLLGGLVLAVFLGRRYARSDQGRRMLLSAGIACPVIGELLVQAAMYRFSSNISLLLKSGVPLLETLGVLARIFHTNPIYEDAILRAQGRVAGGRPLATSLEETGLFPSMVTNMVRTGEESGQLASVMEQLSPYYKEKMEAMVTQATKLLEPVIILGMGATVAGLMLAIYLPMFEMAGKVH